MPSEKSLFRKLQTVVEIAKSGGASTLGELCQTVKDRGPDIFVTRRYEPTRDMFVSEISLKTIKRTVLFSRALGLLSDDGALTPLGREAVRRSRFSAVIASQTRAKLAQNGIKINELNDIIREKLRAHKPTLPTADVLWEELQPSLPRGVFSKLLTLLTYCNEGQYSQRKVYLHFDERG